MTSESKYRTFPGQSRSDAAQRQEKVYRAKRLRVARHLADQLHVMPDGSRMNFFGSGGGEKLAGESGVPLPAVWAAQITRCGRTIASRAGGPGQQ